MRECRIEMVRLDHGRDNTTPILSPTIAIDVGFGRTPVITVYLDVMHAAARWSDEATWRSAFARDEG